ncbi:MAG: hypothetical protein Q9181_001057 [Wetmoreana brouardii]
MFLGGHQKPWMTGPNELKGQIGYKTPRQGDGIKRSGGLRERPGNQSTVLTPMGNQNGPPVELHQALSNRQSPSTRNSTFTGPLGKPLQRDPPGACLDTVAVLPSPAPSDEHHSDSVQTIESELEPYGQPPSVESGQRLSSQSNEVPEMHGGTEGWRQGPCLAQSPMTPPLSTTTAAHEHQQNRQVPGSTTENQAINKGAPSRKRSASRAGFARDFGGHINAATSSKSGAMPVVPPGNYPRPSDAQMHSFRQEILLRQKLIISRRHVRGDTEPARLSLLHDACAQNDHFYLLMHKIYCMDVNSQDTFRQLNGVGFRQEHYQGLTNLIPLLLANSPGMVKDAIDWFAEFPIPFGAMLHQYQIYRDLTKTLKVFLARLACNWMPYREQCKKRYYPPLVDELMSVLGIESPILQGVVFRAIFKDIWIGESTDPCFHEGYKIFCQNQQMVQQRSENRSLAEKQADDQHLIIKYKHLRLIHAGHQQAQNLNADARSPPLPNSQSRPASIQAQVAPQQSSGMRQVLRGRTSFNQVRGPLPPNIDTRVAQDASAVMTSGTTPVVPSQTSLQERNSPMLLQDISRKLSSSPHITAPSAGPYASQGSRFVNSVSSTAMASYISGSTQHPAFSSTSRSPVASRSPATSNLAPSYSHRLIQSNRSPSNPNSSNQVHGVSGQQPIHSNRSVQRPQPVVNGPPQVVRRQLLLPPSNQVLSTTAHPNPSIAALHQFQARSPILTAINGNGLPLSYNNHFRYVSAVTILPDRLRIGYRQYVEWKFTVDEEEFALLSGTVERQDGSAPTRAVKVGSRFYRLRCVNAANCDGSTGESDWVTASQVWPANVAVVLNGDPLQIRKKIHYGKDLPIDVTASVKQGDNILSISILRAQKEDITEYAIALEAIKLLDTEAVKAMAGILPYDEARLRILQRFQSRDPDIEVVNVSVTLNLADPYTSCIWDVPMRGENCRHDECFDLDTFLQTRSSKEPNQPCDADQFKCPICSGDARPQSLVKDEFFVVLRQELAKKNRLDVKAIVLQQNGQWEIKEEEKTGEAGDGSGSGVGANEQSAVNAPATGDGNSWRDSEIIALDSD